MTAHIAIEPLPKRAHLASGSCSCPMCLASRRHALIDRLANRSLSIALRHAQEAEGYMAEAARPKGALPSSYQLPSTAFRVQWTSPVTLDRVRGSDPRSLRATGKQRVYAIFRKGSSKPLYVGHVHGSAQSVLNRIRQHIDGKTAGKAGSATHGLSAALAAAAKADQLREFYIQAGSYQAPPAYHMGRKPTPNMTRVIEGLLQQVLLPTYWDPDVSTFEQERDDAYSG